MSEAAAEKKSLKAVEKDIRLKQQIPVALKGGKEKGTVNRQEMTNICCSFCNNLYASKTKVQLNAPKEREILVPSVLPEETEAAIKVFKNGKISGKDNIRPEHLKSGG